MQEDQPNPEQSTVTVLKGDTYHTQVPTAMLRRSDMTMQAKGLLSFLLTLPQDKKINLTDLHQHFENGRDAVIKAFRELEEFGFVRKSDPIKIHGRFAGYNYTVTENPLRFFRDG